MHSITEHAQFNYSVSDIHYIYMRAQFEAFYLFSTATFLCQVQGSIKLRFRFYFHSIVCMFVIATIRRC